MGKRRRTSIGRPFRRESRQKAGSSTLIEIADERIRNQASPQDYTITYGSRCNFDAKLGIVVTIHRKFRNLQVVSCGETELVGSSNTDFHISLTIAMNRYRPRGLQRPPGPENRRRGSDSPADRGGEPLHRGSPCRRGIPTAENLPAASAGWSARLRAGRRTR